MQINVKVFANLRDKVTPKAPIGEAIQIDIEPNSTIRDVLGKINLVEEDIAIIFIKGVHHTLDHQITEEGTSISLFSPSGGG